MEPPVSFERAFDGYLAALARAARPPRGARLLARASLAVQGSPAATWLLTRWGLERLVFNLGRAGFDMTYYAAKLRETGFRFKWGRFEDVILSCAGDPSLPVAAGSRRERRRFSP